MNNEDFQKLVLSVKQMGTIMQGGKLAHRRTTVTDLNMKGLRERTGLTQADFSQMIGVSIRTLQNWEQGRRDAGSLKGRPRPCCASSSAIHRRF